MQAAGWKVGLLVLIFLGLSYGVYTLFGAKFKQASTYTIYVDLDNAGGLTRGAKVMMTGVEIGTVTEVRLATARRAQATLSINKLQLIPEGSYAKLPTGVLLPTDMRVEIIPPAVSTVNLPPGSRIKGVLGESLEGIIPEGKKTLIAFQDTLKSLQKVLNDQAYQNRIKSILANADKTSTEISLLAHRFNKFSSDHEAILDRIIRDVASATHDATVAVASATDLIRDPQWKSRAEVLLDSIQDTMDKTNKIVQSVHELVDDPKLRQNIDATMANVSELTAKGNEMAATGKEIASNVKTFSEKANGLVEQAADVADEAKRLLNRLNEIAQSVPTISTPKFKEPKIKLDFQRNTGVGLFRTDISVLYPIGKDSYALAGVYDATETNKINLQYKVKALDNLWTRYGLYASKVGVGVDYDLSHRVSLSADLFDPNDATLNLRSRFRMGPNWGAYFGFDRLFQDNDFVFGVSVER
jgi:phospholipid/cholesterol/gamma-HCH transport system substrate-binding protein